MSSRSASLRDGLASSTRPSSFKTEERIPCEADSRGSSASASCASASASFPLPVSTRRSARSRSAQRSCGSSSMMRSSALIASLGLWRRHSACKAQSPTWFGCFAVPSSSSVSAASSPCSSATDRINPRHALMESGWISISERQ